MKKIFENPFAVIFEDGEWVYVINREQYKKRHDIVGQGFYLSDYAGRNIFKDSAAEKKLRKEFPNL